MSEMVERVARALFASVDDATDSTWEETDAAIREACLRDARAAIAAMREPTAQMVAASANAHMVGWNNQKRDGLAPDRVFFWRSMIDAALKSAK